MAASSFSFRAGTPENQRSPQKPYSMPSKASLTNNQVRARLFQRGQVAAAGAQILHDFAHLLTDLNLKKIDKPRPFLHLIKICTLGSMDVV